MPEIVYRPRDCTEKLSIKLHIGDEYDSAWYKIYFSPVESITTGEAAWAIKIYLTDYAGEQQFGAPISNFVLKTPSLVRSLQLAISRVLDDLKHKSNGGRN